MKNISALINARTLSSRLPRKLLLPFNGSTLIDIALEKLDKMDFFDNRYFAAAEDELLDKARNYKNIKILKRDPISIKPGYGDHQKIYAHYKLIETKYFMWINPCHPLLSIKTIKQAFDQYNENEFNSYTSVIKTQDWIFNNLGEPITNKTPEMLSSDHSERFYKVAHAFHIINKEFFMKNNQVWTLRRNDPHLLEIPEEEAYDVNTKKEFEIAKSAYKDSIFN